MEKTTPLIKKNEFKDDNFFKIKDYYLNFIKKQEILGEPFFDKLGQLKHFYIPICNSIYKDYKKKNKTLIVGLSGGQGSGKSTIAQILKLILKLKYNLKVASFSIDDFYKTLSERKKMAKNVHKLFLTRGVPGTHDTSFLLNSIKRLKAKKFKRVLIPKFDKSTDNRKVKKKWKKVEKKPNIIIFEGWCIGAEHQTLKNLNVPINYLEKKYDEKVTWRKKVNTELKNNYKKIFNLIDKLIFLKVPSFKYVIKWRQLQEKKLRLSSKGKETMTKNEVNRFIMYYERITKQMLKNLSLKSSVIINLDKKHRLNSIKFN